MTMTTRFYRFGSACLLLGLLAASLIAVPMASGADSRNRSLEVDEGTSLLSTQSEATVTLQDIDSGLTSPTGNYRWRDVADQLYSDAYRDNYNYTQATVQITYHTVSDTLQGTLTATNLKANFAYQLKLVGDPGTVANENVGLTGRWWQEEWDGSKWTNGRNLNNKGDGSSPNPNDDTYFARRDEPDETSPTGLKYRYTGYLPFEYFITDGDGYATLEFNQDSSYHVLFTTSQRSRGSNDGPLKTTTFDADDSAAYPDTGGDAYEVQTVEVFGEWERLPMGGVFLPAGDYQVQIMLTEESFHSSLEYGGNWAAAMGADIDFTIVAEAATAPVVGDIPDQTIAEGESFASINLDDYVDDPDHTADEMTWAHSGNSELSVSIVNGVATVSPPSPDWSGSETITFTATDPDGQSDSDAAIFTVTPANDAPVVDGIPDQTIAEGGSFADVHLDDYVTDVDNTADEMTWTYSGNSELSVAIVGRVATVSTPDPHWHGSEAITFTATDPGGESDSDTATFTVTPVNDPPVVDGIPDQTVTAGESFADIHLDAYVTDVDDTAEEMTWTASGNSELSVSIVDRVATILPPSPDWSGSETITFTATDPGGESDSDTATFTVTPIDDAPVVEGIPDQIMSAAGTFADIRLDDYVTDVDNTAEEMTWTVTGNSELSVSIVNRVATVSPPSPDWTGSETITFTATDPDGQSDSDDATFSGRIPLLRLEPTAETVSAGGEIDIDVLLTANGVCGLQFELAFDPALLEVVDADGDTTNGTQISVGSMWSDAGGTDFLVLENQVTDGNIGFSAMLLGEPCPSDFQAGQTARIRFRGLGDGTSNLTLRDVIVGGTVDEGAIEPVYLDDGTLTVIAGGSIEGQVVLEGRDDWSGATVTVSGGPGGPYTTGVTNADGTWSISGVLSGTYQVAVDMPQYLDGLKMGVAVSAGVITTLDPVTLLGGDCDDTGQGVNPGYIDIYDMTIVGTAYKTDPVSDWRADINADGVVDIFDAILVGQNWHKAGPISW